jgi:hypothetical protein
MLSSDGYGRFLDRIESEIDSADREVKERAERTLRAIAGNYRRQISARLEYERSMVDSAESTGNEAAAQHHRVLAGVYSSMLGEEELA